MNASKPEMSSRQADAISAAILEGNASNGARGEAATISKARGEEFSSETMAALVQNVGAPSIAEIEKLIGEIRAARSYLESEGQRIQQEMARYAHLSDTASASVKVITESLGQWRNGNNAARTASPSDRRADAA